MFNSLAYVEGGSYTISPLTYHLFILDKYKPIKSVAWRY